MFSIIVPVFNTLPENLIRCVDSIMEQTYKDFEVLMVNDCSTSIDTVRCLESLENSYSQVKIYSARKNGGPSKARNLGIDNASGEYIMFVDSDDWLEKNAFKTISDYLQDEKLDLIIFDSYVVCGDEKTSDRSLPHELIYDGKNKDNILSYMISTTFLNNVWRMAFSSCVINDNQIRFPIDIVYGEDFCFVYEYLKHSNGGKYIKKQLYNYYINDSGLTKQFDIKKYDNAMYVYKMKQQLIYECLKDSDKYKCVLDADYIRIFFGITNTALYNHVDRRIIEGYLKNSSIQDLLRQKCYVGFETNVKALLLKRRLFFVIRILGSLKNIVNR